MCEGHDHNHDAIDHDIALFDVHQRRVDEYQNAAFKMPPPRAYKDGALVWLRDHYNTGRVVAEIGDPSATPIRDVRYVVETTDASGSPMRLSYAIDRLRPATVEHVFRWPGVAPRGNSHVEPTYDERPSLRDSFPGDCADHD